MKNFSLGCMGAALILLFIGCSSAPSAQIEATTMNIANPAVYIAPLTPDSYTVLGRISGSGEVSFNSDTNTYTGDTLKYGSLGDLSSIGHVQNVTTSSFYGLVQNTQSVVTTPSNSREMAIGNAIYELIERANALGADAIIFVTTSVEATGSASSRTTTTKATVRGIAIKMN